MDFCIIKKIRSVINSKMLLVGYCYNYEKSFGDYFCFQKCLLGHGYCEICWWIRLRWINSIAWPQLDVTTFYESRCTVFYSWYQYCDTWKDKISTSILRGKLLAVNIIKLPQLSVVEIYNWVLFTVNVLHKYTHR